MQVIGIIPARYASTRFPGKPLADIGGKSMIQRVYEQASKCVHLNEVVVATDDERIYKHVQAFGKVIMTGSHHPSGTDRCMEAITRIMPGKYTEQDIVINIQGDEPFIQPDQIKQLSVLFNQKACQIASLAKKIEKADELFAPRVVKVVMNAAQQAVYFSRSPIPHAASLQKEQWLSHHDYYKHIGIYGYRIHTLKAICQLPQGRLEKAESLEQLRWIENGFPVQMGITTYNNMSVDTPDDLEEIKKSGAFIRSFL
jgi:3-deoxy-manno-octulosonate cytidylyltransferase (CMP-KDO synthetase)